ncbi:MAG: SH3 domain-containing protein [Verrucomicrobia bacterium]|nr:SH3 domain-containing protein [Verrucomicrobiota bacterium]MBU1734187.1 SH3 domain-containing protein [Verrucomicrobiota bacterium]MBU1856523.1 SH3 domain-containing protein [Verrucomicrobiota bacterium]
MKRWLVIMITVVGLCLGTGAQTATLTRVKVLKNNCNLRAKALVTSEVVGQVSKNDILAAKMIDKEWVEVVPPTNVDLWVLGDYVKDGAINCSQKVNVRAGAGINFNIVGQLPQGEKVEVRGTHTEWIKIAPSPACSLWISRSLVSEIPLNYVGPAKLEPAKAEPVKPMPTPAPVSVVAIVPPAKPEPEVKPPIPLSKPAEPIAPAVAGVPAPSPAQTGVFTPPPGLDLVSNTEQGRWCEVDGILRAKDFIFRTPSDFRLVTSDGGDKNSVTICFVKGNQAQLEALMYRHLLISGREYWVKRQKYPVLVPERIVLK